MTSFDPDSRDPGLAAERTDLAWDRSGLSLLVCGVAVLRGIGRPPLTRGDHAIGACILVLGFVTWLLGWWSARRGRARGARPTGPTDLLPVALGVALVGTAAFVIAAFFPS